MQNLFEMQYLNSVCIFNVYIDLFLPSIQLYHVECHTL